MSALVSGGIRGGFLLPFARGAPGLVKSGSARLQISVTESCFRAARLAGELPSCSVPLRRAEELQLSGCWGTSSVVS